MLKINDCKIIKRSFNLLFLVVKRVKDDSFVNFIFHDCDCVKRKSESIRVLSRIYIVIILFISMYEKECEVFFSFFIEFIL